MSVKLDILIYGIGKEMQKVLRHINLDKVNIIGFIVEEKYLDGLTIEGYRLIHITKIKNENCNYILILKCNYTGATRKLRRRGISRKKIIQFYNYTYFLTQLNSYNCMRTNDKLLPEIFKSVYASRYFPEF